MAATVLSLNIGASEPNPAKDVQVTGFNKRPVASAVLRAPGPKHGGLGSGLEGDFIGDRQSHGGDRQAVYAFAREELDWWEERLGRSLESGSFGENLTTAGLAVDDSVVGDRWSVGAEVVLEVTGPRIPCATFRHRMGERGWLRRFTEVGRSGAYLAVITGGVVRSGDPIEVVDRPDHGITVPLAFRAFSGDLDAAVRVVAAHCLGEVDEDWLRERIARRTR
jgi:MOSC domain-containing protein YiiM